MKISLNFAKIVIALVQNLGIIKYLVLFFTEWPEINSQVNQWSDNDCYTENTYSSRRLLIQHI